MAVQHTDYETVEASQTAQVLGPNGNSGDVLERLIIVPAAVAAGAVSIKDGTAGDAIVVYAAGVNLVDIAPIVVEIGARCTAVGGWQVTTGASVSVIAVGRFT